MAIVDKLYFIWDSVSAQFISVKKINDLWFLVDVEVPYSKNLFPKAMNWLVCSDLTEWIQIVEKAEYCQSVFN